MTSNGATFVCTTGMVDLVIRMFPPFPVEGFSPNFTGYNMDKDINWFEVYKFMAHAPNMTAFWVSFTGQSITAPFTNE